MGAPRSKAEAAPAEARGGRPTARAAQERSDQAGVWGRLAPMINRCLAAQRPAGARLQRRESAEDLLRNRQPGRQRNLQPKETTR